eukprot:321645-Amphidinium_carterae.1
MDSNCVMLCVRDVSDHDSLAVVIQATQTSSNYSTVALRTMAYVDQDVAMLAVEEITSGSPGATGSAGSTPAKF